MHAISCARSQIRALREFALPAAFLQREGTAADVKVSLWESSVARYKAALKARAAQLEVLDYNLLRVSPPPSSSALPLPLLSRSADASYRGAIFGLRREQIDIADRKGLEITLLCVLLALLDGEGEDALGDATMEGESSPATTPAATAEPGTSAMGAAKGMPGQGQGTASNEVEITAYGEVRRPLPFPPLLAALGR